LNGYVKKRRGHLAVRRKRVNGSIKVDQSLIEIHHPGHVFDRDPGAGSLAMAQIAAIARRSFRWFVTGYRGSPLRYDQQLFAARKHLSNTTSNSARRE
jgi:hypothetical protein